MTIYPDSVYNALQPVSNYAKTVNRRHLFHDIITPFVAKLQYLNNYTLHTLFVFTQIHVNGHLTISMFQ